VSPRGEAAGGHVGTVTRGQGEVTTLRVAGGGPGWQVAGVGATPTLP